MITKHKHKHWVHDFNFRLITNTLFNVLSLQAKVIPLTKQKGLSKELHVTFWICQNFLHTHSWFKIYCKLKCHSQYIIKFLYKKHYLKYLCKIWSLVQEQLAAPQCKGGPCAGRRQETTGHSPKTETSNFKIC